VILIAKVATGLVGAALVAGGIVSSQGFIHVRVESQQAAGPHVRLVLPAMAAPIALRFVPRPQLRESTEELRPWLPAIEAAASGLSDAASGPLVQVTEPGRQVTVAKDDGSLVVCVENPGQAVYVSVPLRTVRSAAAVVAERDGPN
jgi:hypothetical protein